MRTGRPSRCSSCPWASPVAWFKSGCRVSEGGACVEVATCSGRVHVRDSKVPHGPSLPTLSQRVVPPRSVGQWLSG
ncbi:MULTISPECIES: DUF397 domain-containing protein [unclassified Streptomyces]|uniref:DUF397 domain-containing protein n=1 Tax=unclassified Streptomyces TaxID=2593676 RepID=UPI00331BDA12